LKVDYFLGHPVLPSKGNRHNTYIAPQAATAASVALYVTDKGGRAV